MVLHQVVPNLHQKKMENSKLFGGGSGAGVTINPIAFIAVSNGEAKLLNIESFQDSQDRAVAMVPDLIDKIVGLFKKDKKENSKKAPMTKILKCQTQQYNSCHS